MTNLTMTNHSEIMVQTGAAWLEGILDIPPKAQSLVIFAHARKNSRLGRSNEVLAHLFAANGLATLRCDLLTPREEAQDNQTHEMRFDVEFLSKRLIGVIDWAQIHSGTLDMPIGLFGSNSGAAAAMIAAVHRPTLVKAVVSCSGRPDLAWDWLPQVHVPALLMVGGQECGVLLLNENARRRMARNPKLETIPAADHLYDDPGSLAEAGGLACRWFQSHLELEAPDE